METENSREKWEKPFRAQIGYLRCQTGKSNFLMLLKIIFRVASDLLCISFRPYDKYNSLGVGAKLGMKSNHVKCPKCDSENLDTRKFCRD